MKKLCYRVEAAKRSDLIIYLCFCVFISVIAIISIKESDGSSIEIGAFTLFFLSISIACFFGNKRDRKMRKELKNTREKGTKVEGTIVQFHVHVTHGVDSKHYSSYYTLTVEYINPYTNETLQYETPELAFDACHQLGSKKCSVYVLDDKVYVTDFIGVERGEESVWVRGD